MGRKKKKAKFAEDRANDSSASKRTRTSDEMELGKALPADWVVRQSRTKNKPYYFNTKTLQSQWNRPGFETVSKGETSTHNMSDRQNETKTTRNTPQMSAVSSYSGTQKKLNTPNTSHPSHAGQTYQNNNRKPGASEDHLPQLSVTKGTQNGGFNFSSPSTSQQTSTHSLTNSASAQFSSQALMHSLPTTDSSRKFIKAKRKLAQHMASDKPQMKTTSNTSSTVQNDHSTNSANVQKPVKSLSTTSANLHHNTSYSFSQNGNKETTSRHRFASIPSTSHVSALSSSHLSSSSVVSPPVLSFPPVASTCSQATSTSAAHTIGHTASFLSNSSIRTDEEDMDIGEDDYLMMAQIGEMRNEIKMDEDFQCEGELTKTFLNTDNISHSRTKFQKVFLVVDTNVLVSDLGLIKKLLAYHNQHLSLQPVVVLPWVVMQELDSLKQDRQKKCSLASIRAREAIRFLNTSLEDGCPGLCGQTPKESREAVDLSIECNDDRVLQCCLQLTRRSQCSLLNSPAECNTVSDVLLLTLDVQLRSKAILAGITLPPRKTDLITWLKERHSSRSSPLPSVTPPPSHLVKSTPLPSVTPPPPPPHLAKDDKGWVSVRQKCEREMRLNEEEEENKMAAAVKTTVDDAIMTCLRQCLETEMKKAYDDIWLTIVHKKPPWSPQDVLACLDKHWRAVFGHVLRRSLGPTCTGLYKNYRKTTATGGLAHQLELLADVKELCEDLRMRSGYQASVQTSLSRLSARQRAATAVGIPYDVTRQRVLASFEDVWKSIMRLGQEFDDKLAVISGQRREDMTSFVAFLVRVNTIHDHYDRLMQTSSTHSPHQDLLMDNLCCSLWKFSVQFKIQDWRPVLVESLRKVFDNKEDIDLLRNGLCQLENIMADISQTHLTSDEISLVQSALQKPSKLSPRVVQ